MLQSMGCTESDTTEATEHSHFTFLAFSVGSAVNNPPARKETQEMWVRSLVREDPLEEEMTTHSSTLAWEIPWTEEPGGLRSIESQRIRHD